MLNLKISIQLCLISNFTKKIRIINKNYKEGRKPPRLNRGPRVLTEAEETTNKVWQLQRLTEYFNEMPLVQFMFSGVEADDGEAMDGRGGRGTAERRSRRREYLPRSAWGGPPSGGDK